MAGEVLETAYIIRNENGNIKLDRYYVHCRLYATKEMAEKYKKNGTVQKVKIVMEKEN